MKTLDANKPKKKTKINNSNNSARNTSCSPNPTPREPRLSPAATMSDDVQSALTPPLLCASILQPASHPQIVAFESWTISAPIGLHPFTLAESLKLDFGPFVCVLPFPLLPLLSDRIDLHLEVPVCNLIVITKRLYYHQSDST